MDYAKALPATGGGFLVAGAMGYWIVAAVVAVVVIVTTLLIRTFMPIK